MAMMFYPMRQWNPFEMLERMMNQWDQHFFGSPWPAMPTLPQYGVEQGDQEVVIHVEVPGVSPEDLSVTVDDHLLTIRAVRRSMSLGDQGDDDQGVATFERSLTLPAGVDPGKITARYHQGVLEIRVPRTEGRTGRQIPIDLE